MSEPMKRTDGRELLDSDAKEEAEAGEKTIAELLDLERALCSDSQDLEHWKSHYIAAMMNWNIALDTIDTQRTTIEGLVGALREIEDHHNETDTWRDIARNALKTADAHNEVVELTQQVREALVEKMAQAGADDSLPRNGMFNSDQLDSMKSERLPDYRQIASVMLKAIGSHHTQALREAQEELKKAETDSESYHRMYLDEERMRVDAEQRAQGLEARVEELEDSIEAGLCKALSNPDCCCNGCLKDAAVAKWNEAEQRADRLAGEVAMLNKELLCFSETKAHFKRLMEHNTSLKGQLEQHTTQLAELRVEIVTIRQKGYQAGLATHQAENAALRAQVEGLNATLKIVDEERDQVLRDHGSSGVGS